MRRDLDCDGTKFHAPSLPNKLLVLAMSITISESSILLLITSILIANLYDLLFMSECVMQTNEINCILHSMVSVCGMLAVLVTLSSAG